MAGKTVLGDISPRVQMPFDMLAGKRLLVSGASGLISSTLIDCLMLGNGAEPKIEVYALGRDGRRLEDRFQAYIHASCFHVLEGDISRVDLSDLQVDYIVHAASPAHPLAYSQTPVDVMKANLLGTLNMLELARRCGARLLFLSSGEIYGTSGDPNSAFREDDYGYIDITNPRSCYPESKRAAETLCASYHAQYGVDAVVARLCHVYGPAITERNTRADAQFLRRVLAHEDIVMKSPGTQVRSFCYVKDAATALLYILVWGVSGEAYNVANRHSIATVREFAQTLAEAGGVGIQNDFPTEEEARGYSRISRAVLDASKLEGLDWVPQYDLAAGVKDMLNDFRKRKSVQ